ncbi:hypothetical protein SEA_CRACKLEWINK_107 [Mycobacterium phage Cracklewink]|uniref:Uncharacterized protein n=1 Tax=Mycobacterium phage Bipper TaxID=1805457 RepID=A0A142F2N5_9CAUD|nr:hypothetical protein KCH39_gp070 [Mycobacterium phage Bipper]AMQ67042.1 hypothetical protein SEA_BIPPER_107 [Mycobacterium phage Bipper]QDF19393.1 hypothetical protein SEA_CRACKLEWINK_107 [Mycobacterium phage Cracklewink]
MSVVIVTPAQALIITAIVVGVIAIGAVVVYWRAGR